MHQRCKAREKSEAFKEKKKTTQKGVYKKTREKAYGQIEIRDYYQT